MTDATRSALTWALAELRGETRYANDDQRQACFVQADAALARPAAPTQSAAQTGEVDPEVIERLIEVMCDCQCEGSHMLSESVANEHADDLRAVLSVFRPSLALSQPEPSQ